MNKTTILSVISSVLWLSGARGAELVQEAQMVIQTVLVGNPGNAPDPHVDFDGNSNRYGSVGYRYRIGKYDVTIAQYCRFLNAVAKSDAYGLYNPRMGTDLNVAGIRRSGVAGSRSYAVMDNGGRSSANLPITYVSWFDAARFANWMSNGQPTGLQGVKTTENGAYALLGKTSGIVRKNAINPNTAAVPTWWIPSENEWYKAAYHKNDGVTGHYWLYATRSNTLPANTGLSGANYDSSGYTNESAIYLTDVGAN
jgi:formylglycine-generating enzyme